MALFRLIPAGDLELVNGDVVWIDGIRHRRQQIATRFRMFKGEWFRDLRLGVPYFEHILVKDPNLDVCRSIFRRVLLLSPGVRSITRFLLVPDWKKRTLGFAFQVVCDVGVLTVDETDRDFLINLDKAA